METKELLSCLEETVTDPSLYQMDPAHTFISQVLKVHFNIVLSFASSSTKRFFFLLKFSIKFLYIYFSTLP